MLASMRDCYASGEPKHIAAARLMGSAVETARKQIAAMGEEDQQRFFYTGNHVAKKRGFRWRFLGDRYIPLLRSCQSQIVAVRIGVLSRPYP